MPLPKSDTPRYTYFELHPQAAARPESIHEKKGPRELRRLQASWKSPEALQIGDRARFWQ